MSMLLTTLATTFGKPIAEKLISSLMTRKNGAQKLEQVAVAVEHGVTVVEALKKSFGKEFLGGLNDALEAGKNLEIKYQAGTALYINLATKKTYSNAPKWKILGDELNINLDRLTTLSLKDKNVSNHFQGLMSVWLDRSREYYSATHQGDIDEASDVINKLIRGEAKNYRQIFEILRTTTLGGVGALMLIAGVLTAMGTGIGVVSAISVFLFGIPWMTVGVLVLPGALLLTLAGKSVKPMDSMSLSIGLAYKLVEKFRKS